uniref:Activator of 90 kDa heat shock protein ATPase isogeny 2 n=1 Tax=Cajanus cajan TaxID=3821 RepID=A0A151R666_CAJCA|nr:Activator of 90 kDa heat shock protein ATPase isogeny 2 [Cajanus cajan]
MARFGEGDKRWIVAERPDGTNVHNWHWAETDCLEWSKAFFKNHLTNVAVATAATAAEASVTITKLQRLDGEAYVNVRKGKVIPGYEISLLIAWEGQLHSAKRSAGKKGCKVISLTERFRCRARDLFEIMMDENMWKGFTQSNARISREVGGEFSIFDGSVIGRNLELQEGKLIVQRWRFGSWPHGMQSTVRIVFEEPETGVTVVKLTHSDVPEEDRYGNATVVENTQRGWRDLIFQRIRAVKGRLLDWQRIILLRKRSVFCNDLANCLLHNCKVLPHVSLVRFVICDHHC